MGTSRGPPQQVRATCFSEIGGSHRPSTCGFAACSAKRLRLFVTVGRPLNLLRAARKAAPFGQHEGGESAGDGPKRQSLFAEQRAKPQLTSRLLANLDSSDLLLPFQRKDAPRHPIAFPCYLHETLSDVAWASRPLWRERPARAIASWHGHLGHDGSRAGRPCDSGRDAHATFELATPWYVAARFERRPGQFPRRLPAPWRRPQL